MADSEEDGAAGAQTGPGPGWAGPGRNYEVKYESKEDGDGFGVSAVQKKACQ